MRDEIFIVGGLGEGVEGPEGLRGGTVDFESGGMGESRRESGITGSGRIKAACLGVVRDGLGVGRAAGSTGLGSINGRPESGVSGCTPYNSKILHVVEAETGATGELGGVVEDPSDCATRSSGRMEDLTDWPVLEDDGGEKMIGEGRDCVLPSQISVDNRIFKSIPKSRPERSKFGGGRNGRVSSFPISSGCV